MNIESFKYSGFNTPLQRIILDGNLKVNNRYLNKEELLYLGPYYRFRGFVYKNIYEFEKITPVETYPELFIFNKEELTYIENMIMLFNKDKNVLSFFRILNTETLIEGDLELIIKYNLPYNEEDVKEILISTLRELNDENKMSFILEKCKFISNININIDINMEYYLDIKNKCPSLKNIKISKESILKFLMRSEISEEDLNDWNELYKSQYGETSNPPPPPDWWLLSRSYNVHTKKALNMTDCRIKLLLKNNSMKDIQKIAEEIEEETKNIAYKHGKEDNVKDLYEYIKNHTITKDTILNCRLDTDRPRYYGFGGIYEQDKSSKLSPENRVEICDIVIRVWEVIQSVKDNREMYETLVTQFVGAFKEHIAAGVCNQGWVGGLTSIFGSYSKELGYLCMSIKEEEINDLVYKFLVDMKDPDVSVEYPTVSKLFSEISTILLDAKYEDDWNYDSHTKEENDSFDKKVKMYDILFEDPNVSKDLKKKTMAEFVDCMLPTFFMRALDYYEGKETIVKIKEASKVAIEDFKQFQLDKICGSTKKKN